MKRAVFFDIDGTLLDCQSGIRYMTPRVKKAIRELQNRDDYVFIASGRPYAFISKELLNFGFNGFIFTNGSQVIVENKLIYERKFNKTFVKKLISDFEKLHVQYVLQSEVYSYIKKEYKELYLYYESYGISREYIKSEYDINNIDVYKMDMLCTSREGVDYCMSLKNEEYDYHYNPSNNVFEFYFKKDTKASGIMKALKYLNIPVENSYAFGDDKNDIEMLETAGCGIAMGNANEEVKKHAKKITDTVQNDGVALAIEKHLLISQ